MKSSRSRKEPYCLVYCSTFGYQGLRCDSSSNSHLALSRLDIYHTRNRACETLSHVSAYYFKVLYCHGERAVEIRHESGRSTCPLV